MERYELPDDWEWRELAQVVEIGSEQIKPSRYPNDAFNYLALENIEQGSGKAIDFTPTPGKNIKSNKFKFTNKHVLYGKLRPYLRKAFAPEFEGVSATDLLPLRPDENNLDRKYLVWWLLSPQILEYVVRKQAGVKMPRLRSGDLAQMPIPVPGLPEQQRIVANIESLFDQSRTARTALECVPALMSQFRRAVLASACRGELVEPDPNDEPATSLLGRIREARLSNAARKLAHSETIDVDSLPTIPKSWTWTTLEMLADIRNGVTKGRDLSGFETIEIPYLRVANVQDGYLDLSEMKTIRIKKSELEKFRLQPNDILFTEGGDRDKLGRGTVWRGEIDICTHQNHVHCARLYLQDIVPDWVSLSSQLPYARDYFFSAANQTVNLASLNSTQLKGLPVPLPPVNEQKRILEKVKTLFAQADIIEQAASVSLHRAEQVDQSILARAFRGELG